MAIQINVTAINRAKIRVNQTKPVSRFREKALRGWILFVVGMLDELINSLLKKYLSYYARGNNSKFLGDIIAPYGYQIT